MPLKFTFYNITVEPKRGCSVQTQFIIIIDAFGMLQAIEAFLPKPLGW